MFDQFKSRLELAGTLTTVTALRISAGRSSEPIGSDLPVIKDILGRPLIPGSSFKGALRSRLESFVRGINPHLAANPTLEAESSIPANSIYDEDGNLLKKGLSSLKEDVEKELNNERDKRSKFDKRLTEKILDILSNQDLTSHFFGSPWIASKFQVRDLTVISEAWFGQYQERDGVAIDRDTETAADGKLYDFQVVPAGTPFEFRAVVENAEAWELGLLMIGLHQFETEQIPLGGGRSRGLGVVKLELNQMLWVDTKNDSKRLMEYLKNLVTGDQPAYEDGFLHRDRWVHDFIDHLSEKVSQLETVTSA